MLHVDFLPFDARAGDETIIQPARAQTIFSSNLTFSIPMVVYGQQYEEIQVSMEWSSYQSCPIDMLCTLCVQLNTGGYLVFGEAVSSSMCSFNLSASSTPTISPVSTLADNCINAAVLHYRVVSQKQQQARDNETLVEVATKISDFNSNLTAFQPSLAVITTWKLTINDVSIQSAQMCVWYQ